MKNKGEEYSAHYVITKTIAIRYAIITTEAIESRYAIIISQTITIEGAIAIWDV